MKPYYLDVLEKRVPGKDLVRELFRRVAGKLAPSGNGDRQYWTPADVIDADGPELNIRSYLEHRDIRKMLADIPAERRSAALELGCGYARLTPVLQEFFAKVYGVEREPGLLEIARTLAPGIEYVPTPALSDLSGVKGPVDFAMTFTVLMHMTDTDARAALEALKAKVGKGWILVVERTDKGEIVGDNSDSAKFMDHGRTVDTFIEWMKPFKLVKTMPRVVEPTYPRKDNGTYMLFTNA